MKSKTLSGAIFTLALVSLSALGATCQERLSTGGPTLSETKQFLIDEIGKADLTATNDGNGGRIGEKVDAVAIDDSKFSISWHYYYMTRDIQIRNPEYPKDNFVEYFDISDLFPSAQLYGIGFIGMPCRQANCVKVMARKDGDVNESSSVRIPPVANGAGLIKALNHFAELCGAKPPLFQ